MSLLKNIPGLTLLFFGLGAACLWGAKKESNDPVTLPTLVSRDGGSPSWSNLDQLQKAAAKGNPQACFELAERFLHADGVAQNYPQAIALLEKAGEGGIANAWFRLGKIYHDGLVGKPDYNRTLDYYTLASRAGVTEAQHNIGAMLVSARGVKRDFVEGLAWLIVAAKSGAASNAESQVRNRMARRPSDIKAAEARAQEIMTDLSDAEIFAERKGGVSSLAKREVRKPAPAPVVQQPTVNPAITMPLIAPPAPPQIALPIVSPPALQFKQ